MFSQSNRVVISADLLTIEPILLPRTLVLIDGRAANVRFLRNHFYRKWEVSSNLIGDISLFELNELPLGKRQAAILNYQLGTDRVK